MRETAEGQARKCRKCLQCPSTINPKQGIASHLEALGFRANCSKVRSCSQIKAGDGRPTEASARFECGGLNENAHWVGV